MTDDEYRAEMERLLRQMFLNGFDRGARGAAKAFLAVLAGMRSAGADQATASAATIEAIRRLAEGEIDLEAIRSEPLS